MLRSVHPFHHIRYLRLEVDPPAQHNPPTKLSPVDAGTVLLSGSFRTTSVSGGEIDSGSQLSLFDEHRSPSFSEPSFHLQQRQFSHEESLSTSPRVPVYSGAFRKPTAAPDRLDPPTFKRQNATPIQDLDDPELPMPHNQFKRRTDLRVPQSKRVKLSYSVASSSAEEGLYDSNPSPLNPGDGVNLPLTGVVAFVDSRTSEGHITSKYWGGILRELGATVTKTFALGCTHVVFYSGCKATVTKYKRTNGEDRPTIVGLEWVDQCKKEGRLVEVDNYLVDLESIPEENFKPRRRRYLPKAPATESHDDSLEEL